MSIKYTSTIIITTLLAACGGGGSSDNPDTDPETNTPSGTVLTGRFIDSPVKGLMYQTPTRSGLTNALGEFAYLEGESVTFYLGGTQLGIALGGRISYSV